ncbi:caspase family protein [Lewinella cohaerens]|uniref:caspase family protein n=1 Tax=Lewinella cohaerens TaxID=70995 RepID=UPI0003820AA7|nr:caspase family protein [Lewinella cohaerens]
MKKLTNLKILSVGINYYLSESIANLNGCVNDVEKLKAFFIETLGVPSENYRTLFNEQADRQGVISSFRDHFKQLKSGDIAVFHFSGHGSWEPSSDEFIAAKLEPYGGKTEVLVCHNSRMPDVYDLADKELRYLIAEAQRKENGQHIPGIQFVCLFDCCHSGSMLRQDESGFSVRMHPGQKNKRPLHKYLEGQYQQMASLRLPEVDFIALTACGPRESALEDTNGGIFTNALVDALSYYHSIQQSPSYAELFSILREYVRQRTSTSQTPYFEYAGNVNPYDLFLNAQRAQQLSYPVLLRHNDKWKVNLGAIHGILSEVVKDLQIPIFYVNEKLQQIGTCRVIRVELEHTVIHQIEIAPAYQHLFSVDTTELTSWQTANFQIQVGLNGWRLPVELLLPAAISASEESSLQSLIHQSPFLQPSDKAHYQLSLRSNHLQLKGPSNKNLIAINDYTPASDRSILHLLSQISKWEQLQRLKNPFSPQVHPDQIQISFEYQHYEKGTICIDRQSVAEDNSPIEVVFNASKGPIPYAIRINHQNSTPLYFYLLHLDRTFRIRQKHENYLKRFIRNDNLYLYQSINEGIGLGIADAEIKEIEDIFIVIAAINKLSIPYAFEQQGLGRNLGKTISVEALLEKGQHNSRDDMPLTIWNEVAWTSRKVIVKTIRSDE